MSTLRRVSKTHPCTVCKKPDYCLFGLDVALCMRVPSQSTKVFSDGTVAYLHRRDGGPLPTLPPKRQDQPTLNCSKLLLKWGVDYGFKSLAYLANSIGVKADALEQSGCVKAPEHGVWAWPMYDGKGYVIGIRMRHESGKKWAVPGSHNGLFLSKKLSRDELWIVEGVTDLAAAISMGQDNCVGRPSCNGGVGFLNETIKRLGIKRATIVADVDDDRLINERTVNPGIQGAMALRELMHIPTRCVTLPTKDLREFSQLGGNAMVFNAVAAPNPWSRK